MPATKIINVSKSDAFEEVFDLFQNATAEEVILIIPRSSKLAKQEAYFTVLQKEADNSNKLISIMTEDSRVENFAQLCGMQILSGPSTTKSKDNKQHDRYGSVPQADSINSPQAIAVVSDVRVDNEEEWENKPLETEQVTESEETRANEQGESQEQDPEEPADENVIEEEVDSTDSTDSEQTSQAMLTSAGSSSRQRLNDIIKEEVEHEVPIKEDNKKTFNVEVKKDTRRASAKSTDKIDQIEVIWAHQRDSGHEPLSRKGRRLRLNLDWILKKINKSEHSRRKQSFNRLLLIAVAIVGLGVMAYTTLGSAKVVIQPKKDQLDFKLNVVSATKFSSVSASLNQIPGQKFSIEKEVSDEFPATGQKNVAQKSRGRIRIFNSMVNRPQRLVATTRFESPAGLIFRIPQTLTVPGAVAEAGGKVTPGSLESEVFADKPGPEYNIGPSSFTVPGFKGSPQYTQFSGLSVAATSGGTVGLARVVTEDDFSKALTALEQKLKEAISVDVKDKILTLRAIGQDKITIGDPKTNVKTGEAAESLKMTLGGSIETLAFREEDIDTLVSNYLQNNGGFDLSQSQLTKNFENEVYQNSDSRLNFTIRVAGTAYMAVDQEKVLNDIAGMTKEQVESYFGTKKEVGSVKIILSPFWVKTIPQDTNKIKITLED